MSSTILEVAMHLWSVSDTSQKQRLMRRSLKNMVSPPQKMIS